MLDRTSELSRNSGASPVGTAPPLHKALRTTALTPLAAPEIGNQSPSIKLGGFPWPCYENHCTTPGDCIMYGCRCA